MFAADSILDGLLSGAVLAMVALLWVVLLVRIVGLRSFSKMTSFDFVMTIAMGSLVAGASQSKGWPTFVQTLAAMAALFVVQFVAARLRQASEKASNLIQNEPVVLMRDGEFDEKALEVTRVSREDIYAKLREANVTAMKNVRAVVLETTGDVSVLHGEALEEVILSGATSAR